MRTEFPVCLVGGAILNRVQFGLSNAEFAIILDGDCCWAGISTPEKCGKRVDYSRALFSTEIRRGKACGFRICSFVFFGRRTPTGLRPFGRLKRSSLVCPSGDDQTLPLALAETMINAYAPA